MKISFKYFSDDDCDTVERIDIIIGHLIDLPEDVDSEELFEKMRDQGLWSKVELNCELDTDTGKVEVLGFNSVH